MVNKIPLKAFFLTLFLGFSDPAMVMAADEIVPSMMVDTRSATLSSQDMPPLEHLHLGNAVLQPLILSSSPTLQPLTLLNNLGLGALAIIHQEAIVHWNEIWDNFVHAQAIADQEQAIADQEAITKQREKLITAYENFATNDNNALFLDFIPQEDAVQQRFTDDAKLMFHWIAASALGGGLPRGDERVSGP